MIFTLRKNKRQPVDEHFSPNEEGWERKVHVFHRKKTGQIIVLVRPAWIQDQK